MKNNWFVYAASKHYRMYDLRILTITLYFANVRFSKPYGKTTSWYSEQKTKMIHNPQTWQ